MKWKRSGISFIRNTEFCMGLVFFYVKLLLSFKPATVKEGQSNNKFVLIYVKVFSLRVWQDINRSDWFPAVKSLYMLWIDDYFENAGEKH